MIIRRDELVNVKEFGELFKVTPGTLQALIKAGELECEVIADGRAERLFINYESFVRRSNAAGLTGAELLKKLAKCSK